MYAARFGVGVHGRLTLCYMHRFADPRSGNTSLGAPLTWIQERGSA